GRQCHRGAGAALAPQDRTGRDREPARLWIHARLVMIRDALPLRPVAAAAVAILAALVLAGTGMSWFFDHHIEQREADALIRDGKRITGGLRLDSAGRPVADNQPGDDRYGEAGSGLYWQLTTSKGSAHSDSLWDQ